MKDIERRVSASGVRAAAERLYGVIVKTPLIENEALNEIAGGRVFLKAEMLQRGGSFKLRGAYNLISQLSEAERRRGVVAWSSGNHAQGVAIAARALGAPAIIVMPEDAPAIKTEMVRRYGAEIVWYDRYTEDREAIGKKLAEERGMVLAPSYDHPDIIEGQGTLAHEVCDELDRIGASLDLFVICCGGGGLTAGCALLLEDRAPQADVWIAEPEGFDEAWASVQAGRRLSADISQKTICDAIATPSPGELTFPVMQWRVRGGASLSENDIKSAVAFAYKHLKLVVEPGGAAALAAVLSGKVPTGDKTTALTLSGGNIDPALFSSILRDFA
ncbi:MAG: threonine/serine dehydratase [Pseudomonadota bacterium]